MIDKNDIIYRKPSWLQKNVKFIYIAALMLSVPCWLWVSWITLNEQAHKDLYQKVYGDLSLFAESLNSELEKYRFIPKVLMLESSFIAQVSNDDLTTTPKLPSQHLQHIRQVTNADEVFVMNAQGTTVVSTKLENIGTEYKNSPFFNSAKAGGSGGFFTLGLYSGIRGYYFSEPLFNPASSKVVGVIVVKVNMARLERNWLNKATPMLITDEYGVVIASSIPSWLFTTRSPLSEVQKQDIRNSSKYPMVSFPLLQTKVHKNTPYGQIVSLPKAGFKRVLEVTKVMPELNWTIYGEGDLTVAKKDVYQGVAISTLLWILLLSLAYVITQRRLQLMETLHRREINQNRLQQAKGQLETRVAERTQELESSNEELKQAQQELIHAAKLATLGQLATSVTHEINQPLTAILASAENAEQWLARQQADKALGNILKIKSLAHKMGLITSHLKTFGRKTDDKTEWVCPQIALDNALSLLLPRITEQGVKTKIQNMSSIQVMANDVRLEQVFINLLTNALDAMNQSPNKQLSIYFKCDMPDNLKQATIYVNDTGSGIDSEHLHHLFDPFFSTKDVGVGLGLGLTISYSIIKTMGGELRAKNSTDGAEFAIQLQAKTR